MRVTHAINSTYKVISFLNWLSLISIGNVHKMLYRKRITNKSDSQSSIQFGSALSTGLQGPASANAFYSIIKHTIYMTKAAQGRNIDVENSNVG